MTSAMEAGCGVYRDHEGMQDAVQRIAQVKGRLHDLHLEDGSKVFNTELISALELENMVECAEAVCHSALSRKESRGAHTCKDHPHRDDSNYLYHTLCYREPAGPRLAKQDVKLGHWEPEERKY